MNKFNFDDTHTHTNSEILWDFYCQYNLKLSLIYCNVGKLCFGKSTFQVQEKKERAISEGLGFKKKERKSDENCQGKCARHIQFQW